MTKNWYTHFIPLLIYFLSLLTQYGISGYYNQKLWNCPIKERFFQKIDHSCIYFLIAGSYTPMCLLVCTKEIGDNLHGYISTEWAVELLIIVWEFALLGIIKTLFIRVLPAIFNTLLYIGIGCSCLPYLVNMGNVLVMRDLIAAMIV